MKTCNHCQSPFEVADEDRKFYEKVSPVFGGQKYLIPEPTHCPDCREQRRTAVVNERFLYPTRCDFCDKRTLSQYPPHAGYRSYCRECWHSDKWDCLEQGRDFDFSRPFFQQIYELKKRTPAQALSLQGTLINSEYIHHAGSSKNCYLIMHADFCENCYYGYGFKHNKNCVDGFYNMQSELCYDCVDVHKCYGLIGCQDCINTHSGAFLRDCVGCKNCFLCVGQREKEYCFRNRQMTKEQYEAKMAEIGLGSYPEYQKYKAELRVLEKKHIFKEYQGHNVQNCTGDHIVNSKDCHYCFDCEDIEGGKYLYQVVTGGKNLYDIYQYGLNLQESYEASICGQESYHVLFGVDCHISSSDVFYCWYLESCRNCFGCTEIHHKNYCILNKQYTKEEYEKLVPKILEHMRNTGEWGEFFPPAVSPFGYNKTTAQMYYPMTKEQVLKKGWKWDDYEVPFPEGVKTIPASRLPDNIKDIPDDILNWAIVCGETGKPFKITAQELKFYREQNLPVPRRHPDQRHMDRFHLRNPRKLWSRKCAGCQKQIQTSWSPDKPEKVYCEQCYLKEVH